MDEIALLTPKEYCEKNRISPPTLSRRLKKGIVKRYQPGGPRTKLLVYSEPDISHGKAAPTPIPSQPSNPSTIASRRGPRARWTRMIVNP